MLRTLSSSPWFIHSRGCNHLFVWSSQRPLNRLLGQTLSRLLRDNSKVRFLAVEDVDNRLDTLRFQHGRDIKIPPFVPVQSHVNLEKVGKAKQARQNLLYFSGTLKNHPLRMFLKRILANQPGCIINDAGIVMKQDNDTTSPHSMEVQVFAITHWFFQILEFLHQLRYCC